MEFGPGNRQPTSAKEYKAQLKGFLSELRARADEGYSRRQLMHSLIPDIGNEIKVTASEVSAALTHYEVACLEGP